MAMQSIYVQLLWQKNTCHCEGATMYSATIDLAFLSLLCVFMHSTIGSSNV